MNAIIIKIDIIIIAIFTIIKIIIDIILILILPLKGIATVPPTPGIKL